MTKEVIGIIIIGLLFITGCIASSLPSACDDAPTDSVLCKLARDNPNPLFRLEDVGNALIMINVVLIGEGLYSKEDAAYVLQNMYDVLGKSVTYVLFKDKFLQYAIKYPDLVQIADSYIDAFSISNRMSDFDRETLKSWIQKRLKSLT